LESTWVSAKAQIEYSTATAPEREVLYVTQLVASSECVGVRGMMELEEALRRFDEEKTLEPLDAPPATEERRRKEYICDLCHKRFVNASKLSRHKRTKHDENVSRLSSQWVSLRRDPTSVRFRVATSPMCACITCNVT